ncbi:hypothetical protein PPYR_03638 [Photinus pyralis]|uniref:CRAL-TRIO domain-containing protein n=1 Tax=Photinus pyralis TaxID=7054 RepID=A0A1Y1JZU5_PHOPY|nr:retinol-binding protein pinta-like [Photinus pyralis]KAB0791838.1 hypothetical protein PPYR_03638 [Photinus pyralis]
MEVRPLPDYLQKVVENELNEVPSRVSDDIRAIKEWLAKQPHLNACTDDQWILMFLRGCKFRLQTVKEKMEEFYLLRTIMSDYFDDRDPLLPEIQELLSRQIILPLPVNKNGPQVFILRTDEGDINTLPLKAILKGGIMMLDMVMKENDHMVLGQYIIFDLEQLQYAYISQLTPLMIRMLVRGLQNAYPTRPKGFFVLNAPPVLKTVFDLTYPLLNKKMANRIHFYTKDNMEELTKLIPYEILPKEYGGGGDSIETIRVEWKQKMEDYREWFVNSSKYRVDESKKIKNCHLENAAETEGSFRKLEID